jgi:hypothetical protein
MASNGTGIRVVAGRPYRFGIDWSPDDRWIVAYADDTRRIELVEVGHRPRHPAPVHRELHHPFVEAVGPPARRVNTVGDRGEPGRVHRLPVRRHRSIFPPGQAPMLRILDRNTGSTLLRRALAAGACALLLACGDGDNPLGPDGPRGQDDFSGSSLSRYTATSDGGDPWSVRGGKLVGEGLGIQAVLIRTGTALEAGWVETRTSFSDDGGLVLGYRDNGNYYLLTMRDDQAPFPRNLENLAVYQRIDGEFRELWNTNVPWPRGTSHTLRFELVAGGGRLRVLMDGELMAEGPVQPTGGTGFGLRHYGADESWENRFDFLRWEITDGTD